MQFLAASVAFAKAKTAPSNRAFVPVFECVRPQQLIAPGRMTSGTLRDVRGIAYVPVL